MKRSISIFAAIGFAAAVAIATPSSVITHAQQQPQQRQAPRARVTFEDLASIPQLGGPVLSPNGREFALVRDGQIALSSAEGGWPSPLTTTTGGKSALDWSADGRALAFVSDGNIWGVPAAGGAPLRLTDSRPGPGDPRAAADRQPQWSPKGSWILFETGRRGNNDLVVVRDDGLTSSFVTSSDADEGNAAWSPDGTRIAYVERSPEHFSGRLLVADIDLTTGRAKGAPRELYVAKDDRGGGWSIPRPAWSPDGQQLAVVLQDSGWDHVYLIPAAGGAPKRVTDGDCEDGTPVFSPDGKSIAITSNRANLEEQHIWIVPLTGSGAAPRRLAPATVGIESNPQWTPDGQHIFFTRATPLAPASLFIASVNASGTNSSNGTNGKTRSHVVIEVRARNVENAGFTPPEEVHFKSRDGLDIAALLYKPIGFKAGNKAPAVLWIHGGPEGQDVFGFDAWAYFLAQEGYLVLKPNYRGSSGYGERFRNLNVEDSGGGELDDVVAGAQYLVAQGFADPGRIAIGGGSHGGTMVAYAVTKQPAVFKAAIELYGVVDRATFLERTNRNSAIRWARKMGGSPEQKPEVYRKANVLPDVPKIATPLLVMHGEDDPQVPPYESTQFVAALKKAGKTHVYVTYPKEGHGFQQREHRLDAWRKQVAFLNRYLQPSSGRSITSTQEIVLDEKR